MKRKPRERSGALLQHFRPDDVGGQKVRRELHPLLGEAERLAERLDELRLGEAGHADEQAMAAGEDGDERLFDDVVLAEDHGADGGAGAADMIEGAIRHVGGGGFGRRDVDRIHERGTIRLRRLSER